MKHSRLRILFVAPYVPSTVRARPYTFIRKLAELGNEVTLVCLVQPEKEAAYLPEIAPYCCAVHPIYLRPSESYRRMLASLPTRTPLSVAYCQSTAFNDVVGKLAGQGHFDLIHTEFARAVPTTAHLNSCKKVFDAVDSLSLAYRRSITAPNVPLLQRGISTWEWLKMHAFEGWAVQKYDRVIASSPVDQGALERKIARVDVIPNGINLGQFTYYDGERDPETLVFVGKMSYYVNVASVLWFYRSVFPRIRKVRPKVKLKIVGRDPKPEIRALAADASVEVTGTLPDVRPYLTQATVAICPMVSGSGTQFKLLEAMAMGTPAVSTTNSYWGLWAKSGQDLLVADGAEAFSTAVLELLDNPGLRGRIAKQGRLYIEKHHHWDQIGCLLSDVYTELMTGTVGGVP